MFCIIFLIFGKKSIICAEDLILREKNFHVKKCYNMYLKRFLCVVDLILVVKGSITNNQITFLCFPTPGSRYQSSSTRTRAFAGANCTHWSTWTGSHSPWTAGQSWRGSWWCRRARRAPACPAAPSACKSCSALAVLSALAPQPWAAALVRARRWARRQGCSKLCSWTRPEVLNSGGKKG